MIINTIAIDLLKNYAKTIHPFHPNYRNYWMEERKRCIHGYWVHGMFMPPKLYFYINHGHIERRKGNTAMIDHPDLRDLEIDFHYTYLEARGFSGFADDPLFTCHRSLIDDTVIKHPSIYRHETIEEEIEEWDEEKKLYVYKTVKKDIKVEKEYVSARTYLRQIHSQHLGKPLYHNPAENIIFMAGRGVGKDVHEDTIVYRKIDKETIIPSKIKDVEIGDEILSYNQRTFVEVKAKKEYNDQVMYTITTKDGRSVKCGAGHLWKIRALSRERLMSTEDIYNHINLYSSYRLSLPIFNAYKSEVLPEDIKKKVVDLIFNNTIFTRNEFNTFSVAEKKSNPGIIKQLIELFKLWGIKYKYSNITDKLWCNLNRILDINKEKDNWVLIKSVTKGIVENSVCIEVEDEIEPTNKLFAVNDYMVTHNSFLLSNIVLHEWLFDGIWDLDDIPERPKSSIVVGASQAKYSIDHLAKTRMSLEALEGGYKIGDTTFVPPFNKRYTGGWGVSSTVTAEYKKRKNGVDTTRGSKSTIKHVSWNGNPFAAQGGRANLLIYEEIGVANELLDVYGATRDLLIRDGVKTGTAVFIGTGGDMEGGGTLAAHKMFYTPRDFECLAFEDTWEHRGSIGYFVPAYYSYNELRDEYGNINIEEGIALLEAKRKRFTDSYNLANDMQNNPKIPSEIFLVQSGNIFPVAELKNVVNKIEGMQDILEKKVTLYFDKNNTTYNGVSYRLDTENELTPINDFPWKDDGKLTLREGCVVIYEFPQLIDGKVPEDTYIVGHDPFRNNIENGTSFASIFVLKSGANPEIGTNELVAEYIGRPFMGDDAVNDMLLKLSLMYNAIIYFENMVGAVKEYFENHRMLHKLALKPSKILASTASNKLTSVYGYSMSNREVKLRSLGYVRQWLLDVDEFGVRNLEKIPSRILLKQFLQFNMDGNFDAVMGFIGCIIGVNERFNKFEERMKELSVTEDDMTFLNKDMLRYRDLRSVWITSI